MTIVYVDTNDYAVIKKDRLVKVAEKVRLDNVFYSLAFEQHAIFSVAAKMGQEIVRQTWFKVHKEKSDDGAYITITIEFDVLKSV